VEVEVDARCDRHGGRLAHVTGQAVLVGDLLDSDIVGNDEPIETPLLEAST
jgi:hypothetical protein